MKTIKVRRVIELLERDGWRLVRTKGDHRQFKCRDKPGTVTVSGKPNDDLDPFLLHSIWKQAGWK
ncbi:MAG: type II toxin-antitoxin system HicA family toxin [Bacteroidales bacterium]|nr:type II toxin-antitoxin system HicA family toxin [Bacteroidales bacterium]